MKDQRDQKNHGNHGNHGADFATYVVNSKEGICLLSGYKTVLSVLLSTSEDSITMARYNPWNNTVSLRVNGKLQKIPIQHFEELVLEWLYNKGFVITEIRSKDSYEAELYRPSELGYDVRYTKLYKYKPIHMLNIMAVIFNLHPRLAGE